MSLPPLLTVFFDGLIADVRFALRTAAKKPGFTMLAVLTMALGIAAATATFSIADVVFLRPLPYKDPNRLVSVHLTSSSFRSNPATTQIWDRFDPGFGRYKELKAQSSAFEDVAAMENSEAWLELSKREQIRRGRISVNFFSVLGAQAVVGRLFSSDDEKPEAQHAAVLSNGIWKRVFGGDQNVVGKAITVSDNHGRDQYIIVGVLPQGFEFPDYSLEYEATPEVWIPLTAPQTSEPADIDVAIIGHLKKGVQIADAQRETGSIILSSVSPFEKTVFGELGVKITPRQADQVSSDLKIALFVALASAALLLVITCGNVANLLLGETAARRHEMVMRVAIGASRTRLTRQLLTESIPLGICGGVTGTFIAYWIVPIFVRMAPVVIPEAASIQVDVRVLLFSLAVSALTGIVFGLAPAISIRSDLQTTLKQVASSRGSRQAGAQGVVIAGEIALVFSLLIMAALLTQTLFRLASDGDRMDSQHLVNVHVDLSAANYQADPQFRNFVDNALQNIKSLAGAQFAAAAYPAPFRGRGLQTVYVEGVPEVQGQSPPMIDNRGVSKDYFAAMGMHIVAGRSFADADMMPDSHVAIISQAMAKKFWPMDNPLNKHFRTEGDNWTTVVGVAEDIRDVESGNEVAPAMIYYPFPPRTGGLSFIIRASGDPARLGPFLRQEIVNAEKNASVDHIDTMDALVWSSLAGERYRTILVNIFAAAAALLALIGLYGVVSRFVTNRTREISIRMALGARAQDVLRLVMKRSVLLTTKGIAIGILIASLTSRWLSNLLFGVHALDWKIYLIVAVSLLAVSSAASYFPARRAARTEVVIALRSE